MSRFKSSVPFSVAIASILSKPIHYTEDGPKPEPKPIDPATAQRIADEQIEEAIEAAYWWFDAAKKHPNAMAERDAFKAAMRRMLAKGREE